MNCPSTQEAAHALQLLAEKSIQREEDLQQYSLSDLPSQFDDDNDSQSPIFDSFYQAGKGAAIMSMTNFDSREFMRIWNYFNGTIASNWKVGRGKKCTFHVKDVLFMTLTVCKHGGHWDFLGRMFNIKGPTMERTVIKFLKMLSEDAYTRMCVNKLDEWTMDKLATEKKLFKTYKFAKYATDVTFQQANRPSGTMEEGKKYYSGKHKLYGYKVEVSVLPNGLAIGCSEHYPGSVSDLDIFYKNIYFHRIAAEKKESEKDITDVGNLVEDYPEQWAILMDKGYQGSADYFRTIHPIKKPKGRSLTSDDEVFNKKVSSDRIIVENYFGRVCSLWGVLSNKWRWNEGIYDIVFKFCLALTNIHVNMHPLRQEDVDFYQKVKARAYKIGEAIITKRKKIQQRYRIKRKKRLSMQFGVQSESDSDLETQDPS